MAYRFQTDREFNEVKGKVKLVQRRLNRNSEQQASIESGNYTYQYVWLTPSAVYILNHGQLHNRRRPMLPMYMRPLLPAQARLHISLRSRPRIHHHIPAAAVPLAHMPTVRLRRVRHLHSAHKEDVPRFKSDAEPR